MDVVALRGQSDRDKDLEIRLLRQQQRLVERTQVQRRGLSRWEKLSLAVLLARFKAVSVGRVERLREVMRLFQPETVLKWHRELVKRKWTFQRTASGGRPRINGELETFIVRFGARKRANGLRENPG